MSSAPWSPVVREWRGEDGGLGKKEAPCITNRPIRKQLTSRLPPIREQLADLISCGRCRNVLEAAVWIQGKAKAEQDTKSLRQQLPVWGKADERNRKQTNLPPRLTSENKKHKNHTNKYKYPPPTHGTAAGTAPRYVGEDRAPGRRVPLCSPPALRVPSLPIPPSSHLVAHLVVSERQGGSRGDAECGLANSKQQPTKNRMPPNDIL